MNPLERSQTLAFLLSLGAVPLGCPAEDGQDSNADTSTSPTTGATDSQGMGTDSVGTTNPSGTTTDPTTDPTTMGTTPGTTASTYTTGDTESTSGGTDATDSADGSTSASASASASTTYGTYGSYGTGGYVCRPMSVPEVCEMYGANFARCFPRYAEYQETVANYCACGLEDAGAYGEGCGAALEEVYACLNAASCRELQSKDVCSTEFTALDEACGGGGGSESGDDVGSGSE